MTSSYDVAATYARHTVEAVSPVAFPRQVPSDVVIGHYVLILRVLTDLEVMGHGDAIREACDRVAEDYGVASLRAGA